MAERGGSEGEVMALPSQQQNPLSGWKVALTWYSDFCLYKTYLEALELALLLFEKTKT